MPATIDSPLAQPDALEDDALQADFFYGDEEYELAFDVPQSIRVLDWIARHVQIASRELAQAGAATGSSAAADAAVQSAEFGDAYIDEEDDEDDQDDAI